MWGALLAATMAAWLHQFTAITGGEDIVHGHGVRGGKAMVIVTKPERVILWIVSVQEARKVSWSSLVK